MIEVTTSALDCQHFLHGLRADQLDTLAATASEVMFPAGHRIFAEGGPADSFWLVASGYVALDVQVPGESPVIIGTVGIGGPLGWSWLLPPVPVGVRRGVRRRGSGRWSSGASAVRDRCAADPDLGHELTQRMFQVLAGRLQDTRDRLIARSVG